ncbi:SusD/RagB family nutrient-binding outer membrane lipoprotein [Rhinopithecimicrobium faecis]|uniref:SusD/RagB family nutrient-binding outer membrane lipoprotein n=1 Tax=Rhinopithecimicrobium faecis TaxID=2820698 RepID=UPI003365AFFA
MKFISTIKKYSWILAALPLALSSVSCSEDAMDEVNKDINHAQDAQAKFILADVITRTAFSNAGGDINTYVSTYVEHEAGVHNQLFLAETRNGAPSTSSTFNNPWGSVYIALKNAKLVISKCSVGGPQAGNDVTKGMGEVLAAYNLALLTDMYGDVPYSQALTLENKQPGLDKQEAIYKEIFALLDAAIVNLAGRDAHVSGAAGNHDLLFAGNTSKWIQFAYGLKARYTMRLLKRSTNVQADMAKVIEYANKSFTSASNEAAFAYYDSKNLNPLFDFQWSRDGLAASQSISDKLVQRNDPRLSRVFISSDWKQIANPAADTLMAPNGATTEIQYYYNTSAFMFAQTAPTLLLSYHEVLFLKAEAMARLGQNAEPVLKEAVKAGIVNTERSVTAAFNAPTVLGYGGLSAVSSAITPAQADTYFDKQVKPLFAKSPLSEIANQKYLAFFGASGEATEAYNDVRRYKALGESWITLANKGKFPLRLPYGNDDTTNNPNVNAAFGDGQYVYSENVWWAGGNR